MRKKLLFTVTCIAWMLAINAQQYPTSLPNHIVSGISTVNFKYENCGLNSSCYTNSEKVKAEVPPWIIAGGWRTYFMVDGTQTWIFSSPASLVDNSEIDFKNNAVGPYLAASPYKKDPNYQYNNFSDHWRRNYHNIWSAHYLVHPQQGGISLGFLHSENKNEVEGGSCSGTHFQNTINPTVLINCNDHSTWSGGTPYEDGWRGYFSLVTAAWTHNNAQTNWGQQYFQNELGPIAWPSNGYVTTNYTNISSGVGGPSSIIEGDYIYIYYLDTGGSTLEEGRNRGIRVVRVLKTEALDPSKYRVYYKDPAGNVLWNPSLPAGLTKENMLQYVSTPGPKGTDVLNTIPGVTHPIRFSVAKVQNSNYFIGIEEYMDLPDVCLGGGSKHKLALRFSEDLVNWSDRILQIGNGDCWNSHRMRYPILLNSNGWTNTEINLNDFYILGAEGINKSINKIHVYYNAPPPPPPGGGGGCPLNVRCVPTIDRHINNAALLEEVNLTVYPNPTLGITNIQFSVHERRRVVMNLFDINGKLLGKVEDRSFDRGSYVKQINLTAKSSGVYFLQVTMGNTSKHFKIIKS